MYSITLNGTHRRTAQCKVHLGSGTEETAISVREVEGCHRQGFQRLWAPPGYGDLLQYMRWEILATDDNKPEVVRNLARAKKVWSRISRILSREGTTHRVSGLFFKAVIQAVLLFRAETWVVTPPHGQGPGGVSDPGV